MPMKYSFFGVLLLLMMQLLSCTSDDAHPEPIEDVRRYCPIEQGSYIVYDVVDTMLDFGNVIRPSHYQMKIRIKEKLNASNAIEKYTVETYKRDDASKDWLQDSMRTIEYSNNKEIIVYEVGVPYVKLVTPFKTGISWNGNKYNTYTSEVYKTRSFAKSYYVSDTVFANTVKVVQNEDFTNAIAYSNKYEVYAKDLGLIHKLFRYYKYNQKGTDIEPNIRIGFIREMKYITHGKE